LLKEEWNLKEFLETNELRTKRRLVGDMTHLMKLKSHAINLTQKHFGIRSHLWEDNIKKD
jgi:hypothetical protein